jgi:hypothetical protein
MAMRKYHWTIRFSLASCLLMGSGCYTLQSANTTPTPGEVMAFDINDAGRVSLGGTIGPEIGQVEGRLVSHDEGQYVMAVSTVRFLRGGEQVWSGERVRINRDQVGNSYVRRFDKGRTIALGAVVVAGVTALVLSRDLIGFGREPEPPGPPGGGEELRAPLRGFRLVVPLFR